MSPRAIEWIEATIGSEVVRSVALIGGMSSAVHRCWLSDGSSVVLRHITDLDWLAREPYLITSERIALDLLADSGVPVPRHLASDPSKGLLVMSHLPGVMVSSREALNNRLEVMADVASRIASFSVPHDVDLPIWRPWVPDRLLPPEGGDATLWQAVFDAYSDRTPPGSEITALLHRDFHPLNLLWDGPEVSGVVDWVNACVGHPHAELSHCRWNLAVLVGADAADTFSRRYLASSGGTYDPWWDLATALGLLPGPIGASGWRAVGRTDLTDAVVMRQTEAFVRAALVRV